MAEAATDEYVRVACRFLKPALVGAVGETEEGARVGCESIAEVAAEPSAEESPESMVKVDIATAPEESVALMGTLPVTYRALELSRT